MTHGPITNAAIAAGTEQQCTTTYNCPKRLDHDGPCAKTVYVWLIPASWTLTNQMCFSRQLQHAARVAADMRTHPSFGGKHMPAMFADYDKQISETGIEQGGTEAALTAYADWLNAVVATTAAARAAKMHTDAPHYMGRPCGATEGKVTSSGSDINCPAHAKQAAAQHEVVILEILVNP